MRYVGRHRGPRPLYLRRPVIGGVAAAVLLGGPAFAYTNNGGISGLIKKPAAGVEASDDPSPTAEPTAAEVTPDTLPSFPVPTKRPQTSKPATANTQDDDPEPYTPPSTRKTTDKPDPKPSKTTTKPDPDPEPSKTKDPDPEPSTTKDPDPQPTFSISLPAN